MTLQSRHTLNNSRVSRQVLPSLRCKDFRLTISLKKTNVLGQDVDTPPVITIDSYQQYVVYQFTYLGSTISDNLSLDAEINQRIGKAAIMLGRLTTRVWENPKLTVATKLERRLNNFHLHCLRRTLGFTWSDKVPSAQVLERDGLPTMYTLLRQRRLRLLGRMKAGRIPKDILYAELASGKIYVGHSQLRYKDACKRDLKALDINTKSWEDTAADRSRWRWTLQRKLKAGDEQIQTLAEEKRVRQKARACEANPATTHTCTRCKRECHSRIQPQMTLYQP
ncbi:hypothetical protein ACOMHN_020913 [Nucella lapillus]